MPTIPHFLAGERRLLRSDSLARPVVSPRDGAPLGEVAPAGPEAVDEIVETAPAAFAGWSPVPIKERVQPLFHFKHLVEANSLLPTPNF